MDPSKVIGYQFEEVETEYTERDVALYALAVGAAGPDPCDPVELPLVYNDLFNDNFKVLPTFGVLFPGSIVEQFLSLEGLAFDPKLLLHGEQYLEVYRPFPPRAKVCSVSRISSLQDKGKAALLEVETISRDASSGEKLCLNRSTCFLRGAGGFSLSQPSTSSTAAGPAAAKPSARNGTPPKGLLPHFVWEEKTQPSQALLYRLCGDYNPLHSDPNFAADAGFERPILHGLCTLGFSTRAIIRCCCGGEPGRVTSVRSRFLRHVFPGETLVTEMWIDSIQESVEFSCKVKERTGLVLSGTARICTLNSRL